jgi:PAS domain S-box-containing protein
MISPPSTEEKESKQLMAKLREVDKAKIKAGDKLMLLISVGKENFNLTAMTAIVILLNEICSEADSALMFVLNIADTLQRFNIAALEKTTPDAQLTNSIILGDKWLLDVTSALAGLRGSIHTIRWEHWRLHANYTAANDKILDLEKKYPEEFSNAMNESINEYVERQKRTLSEICSPLMETKFRKYCEKYLREEITTMLLWKETGCKFVLYPGRQTAIMSFISEKLIYPENPELLQWLTIRLKRIHNRLSLLQAKNTLFLEKVIASTIGHIYWKDVNGIYLGCNDNQAKTLGYSSSKEIIGKTDFDLPWKEHAHFLRKIDLEVMQSRKPYSTEEPVIVDSFKDLRIFLSKKAPLEDEHGKPIGILGISIDITDHKKAEQLQKEKEVAEKVSKAVEAISGSIAHELRTPLSIVGINTDNLKIALTNFSASVEQKKEIENIIKNIKFAIKSGAHIITMLLTKIRRIFCKVDSVDLTTFESVSIMCCINSVIEEYPFCNNESEFINWDNKSNKDFAFKGDLILTKQILFNLIKNALRAIDALGRGEIYINLKTENDFNCLVFKDTAAGMSPKAMETLFEPFIGHSKDSSGLGLTFCKMIMESYAGDITCISKEGEYTEFTLSFPVMPSGQNITQTIQAE